MKITDKKDKVLINSSALVVANTIIDEIAKNAPGINIAWGLSKAYLGAGMKLRQERALEWVEMVRGNPNIFTKQVFNDEQLQDGFVYAFEKYLTARSKEKRSYLRSVMLGFAKSSTKDAFELERLDDALLKISPQAMKFLMFLKKEILPLKEKMLRAELKNKNIKESGKSEEWWLSQGWEREPLFRFINQWLHDNFNPNSQRVKAQYGVQEDWDKSLIDQVYEKESEKKKEFYTAIDELVNLGILKLQVATGGGFSMAGGATYDFSGFGNEFLKYVEDDVLS